MHAGETSGQRARIAYLDNARYWVMLLVVVGHALTEFVQFPAARDAYLWIYLFHMPFFALISGYTARHHVADGPHIRRMIGTLVVPYLIVETSLQLLTRHYDGEPRHLMLLSPQWVGWFLAALFIWRLTTPIWRHLRHPVTVAVLISLAVPLVEVPNVLALPKVLGFLPFYVIGLHFRREWFTWLAGVPQRIVAAALLAGTAMACRFVPDDWPSQWLLYKHRYDEDPLNAGPVEGILIRAGLIALGLVLSLAVLSLVPHGRSVTSALGQRTFYAYLLHGFFIIVVDREYHLWARLETYGEYGVLMTVAGSILLASWLMTWPIAAIFRPLFEPKLNWLFRDKPRSPAA